MRWWREFWKPELKCERIGHVPRERKRWGTRYPSTMRGVADSVTEKGEICDRCGEVLKPWHEVGRHPIHKLTMDSASWNKLEEEGELW